jgi:sugar phosphate isomerase/epimerase
MLIALHSLATAHADLPTSVEIGRETGYAGIEISKGKLDSCLALGHDLARLRALFDDLPLVGLSYVQDIERREPREYAALVEECESLCSTAERLRSPMIQLLSGPLDPSGAYQGLKGKPWPEMRKLTAKNLSALADIGKAHNVKFYLEGLAFTPLGRLDRQLEVLEETARENVGLVLDFYHLWDSGTRPEEIAKVDKKSIFCVDFCDSLDQFGAGGDSAQRGRDVWTGAGRVPLKEWVDAVRATGFDGVWRCELLSPTYWKLDPWKTARDLKAFFEYMFV